MSIILIGPPIEGEGEFQVFTLMQAAWEGHTNVVKALLKKAGAKD